MSTEQSLDPQLIEQTKQQIRSLVAEIAQLSKEDITPQEFYQEFLTRVVSALAAIGGAVWARNDDGRLALQYQINLQETKLLESEDAQAKHGRLLYKAMQTGEGVLVPPNSGHGDDDEAANPTNFLVVLGPMKTDLEVAGVLEIFQRAEAGPNTQRGYLRFVTQMCDLAADYLKSHQLRHFSDRQVMWSQLEDFTHMVHTALDPLETAYTIANEGRRLIECDRVSVAIRKGSKCTIEAVSGQDVFDKRSNTVRLLGKLATAVVATGETVWYTGDTSDMAPQVEDAIQEYVDDSHSKTVAVLPLKPPKTEEQDDPDEPPKDEAPFGALIIEQIEDSRIPQSMVQRVEVVARHSATALGNSLEHNSLFLMPVWRTIGKAKWIVQARTLPKTISISVAVLLVLLGLVLWPADFEINVKGTLEPVQRHDVFARIDGVVKELDVRHGDVVKHGQVLARLNNTDLQVALEDVRGRRLTTMKQILSKQREIKEGRLSVEDRNRLYGELAALQQQYKSLETQLVLYEEKQRDLDIVSPASGRIVTWDLYRRLIHRPVQRGQVLMQVADPSGDWELELHVPDDRMGFITQGQAELRQKGENEKADALPVTYVLATDPDQEFEGTVKEMHLSAEVRGDEGNTVLIKTAIDKEKLPHLRPGATVNAKIYCGRCAIGYVWFHDLVSWVHRLWFRFF